MELSTIVIALLVLFTISFVIAVIRRGVIGEIGFYIMVDALTDLLCLVPYIIASMLED